MTWVIAILLALILVALISSNQGSANGVKKVIGYSAAAGLFLLSWTVLIGYVLWFNEMSEAETLSSLLGLGMVVLGYPAILWINKKKISNAYAENRTAALKSGGKITAIVIAWMLFFVIAHEIQKSGLGGLVFGTMIGIFGLILVLRSASDPKSLRKIWLGPLSSENVWTLIDAERQRFENAEALRFAQEKVDWDNLSEDEQDAVNLAHWERVREFDQLLKDREARLLAERIAWEKRILREPFLYFWFSVSMAAFSFVGDIWTQTHEYLMGTSLVKGQNWLATTLIIMGLFGLLWAFVRFREILKD